MGCTQEKTETPPPEATIDQVLELTNVMKYFFAGDVISTDVLYAPQGVNFGELLLGKKVTKTISIQNSPLFEDFPTDIKIEEKSPKVFSLDSSDCGILKTGGSCKIVISANYSDNLFTSTKTARLVIGKKDGTDLYLEIFGQIRNVNITSNQFESNFSISMEKDFNTDYAQFTLQERVVKITNNSATKYLRNDYIIPRLVGANPTDFYISANDCMYPIAAGGTCDIRVIYKKWKTTTTASDTELKFPGIVQNYSLKFGQLVTYTPVYSAWGTCSKTTACTGVGTQTRTIDDCIKNDLFSVSPSNCTGTVVQNCDSPFGDRTLNIVGGTMYQTCQAGANQWVSQSVTCSEDFHEGSLNCIPDTFIGTYSAYSPATNPLTEVCSGFINATRSVISCIRAHNNQVVPTSKCIDPDPILTHNAPSGNRSIPISNGIQDQTCLEGGSSWLVANVICDSGYYRDGDICSPIVYVPTLSAYTTSPVSTTVCLGTDTVTRTITSCKMQHNNQVVANNLCSDPAANLLIESPQGSQLVNLFDQNTFQLMGSQSQFCAKGDTVWAPINTNCYQYYSVNGNSCLANNLATPQASNVSGTVYSTSANYSYDVLADLNATNLDIYKDGACTQQIGTGLSLGLLWNVITSFTPNQITNVYAKSSNSYTLKQSQCGYLFSYMYDTMPPSATLSLNNGATKTTLSSISLDFSNLIENSGTIQSMEIYEQASCGGNPVIVPFENNYAYTPSTKGSNLTISVKLIDIAGNNSSCISDSILYGMEVEPLFANAVNWMTYVNPVTGTACSGSGVENCVHGGERKVVRLDQTSCDGLLMIDDEEFFEWSCEPDPDNSGKVRFVSNRINDEKGLNFLIDDTGVSPSWIPNKVNLVNSSQEVVNTSIISNWYNNPLTYASTGCYNSSNVVQSSFLKQSDCVLAGHSWYVGNPSLANYPISGTAGTLFIVRKTDRSVEGFEDFKTKGISLSSDSIGIVIMPGIRLNAVTNTQANIVATGRKYLYIEGYLVGFGTPVSSIGVSLSSTNYSFVHSGVLQNFTFGIRLSSSNYNTIKDYNVLLQGSHGIYLTSSSNNMIYKNVTVSNNGAGVYLETNSNSNILSRLTTSNNYNATTGHGIWIASSSNNTIYKVSSSNNVLNGLYGTSSNSNKVSVSSFISNGNAGILFSNSSLNRFTSLNINMNNAAGITQSSSPYNIVHNALILNNNKIGYSLSSSTQNLASQLAVFTTTNSSVTEAAILYDSSLWNKLSGNIFVGVNAPNCRRTGSSNDNSGLNASCAASGLSDFTLTDAGTNPTSSSFVTQNPTATIPYALDSFAVFIDQNTAYQLNDNTLGPSARGRCSSGNCLKFDFSLSFFDPLLKARSDNPLTTNSLSSVLPNSVCPVEVAGNKIINHAGCYIGSAWSTTLKTASDCSLGGGTWSSLDSPPGVFAQPKVFLKSAIEVVDPLSPAYSAGNHDGLCEAGESCIYAPNYGVYQGEGQLLSCNFDPQGGLTGIIMWGYSQNGR